MGMPALKLEFEEVEVEERLARLESSVEHIQSDVSEIKGDIRRLDNKIDRVEQTLSGKIDSLKDSTAAKFDVVIASISALAISNEQSRSKLVALGYTLYITLAAGLLTVIARSLHWF